MPNQLENLRADGSTVSVVFPIPSFTLPKNIRLYKVSDHELNLEVDYSVKVMKFFSITRTGSVYYNLDTGTVKVNP